MEHRCLWEGSVKSGEMRTDAATLIRQLRADGFIKTNKDAYAFIELYLSVEHRCLWEGSVEGGVESGKMRTDSTTYFLI